VSEDAQAMAYASSVDRVLADAASVAEAVVTAFSQSNGVVKEPDVVVVDDGHVALDEHFNQLDELDSQLSQSIIANCGPGGAPPGGELRNGSQINKNNCNLSNSNGSESILSDNVSESIIENENNNVNESSSIATPVDTEMSQASDPRKRAISGDSSEDFESGPSVPSSSSPVPEPKVPSKKLKKSTGAPSL